jgi:KaiC/GvpD/RAD55 family RecA-like ATPase
MQTYILGESESLPGRRGVHGCPEGLRMIREKLKTGVPGLDQMLDGGLIPGRPYIVSGTSGTGKTTLAVRFLLEGAKNGEQVLYVALDEPPNEVKANMGSLGWDLSGVTVFDATLDVMSYDKTPVRDVSSERKPVQMNTLGDAIRKTPDKGPADMTVNTLQEMLKQEMRLKKYTRVVIDSTTSIERFYIRTSEEYATMQSFFRLMSDLGVTSILTVQLPEVTPPTAESRMARAEIRLHKWFDGKGMNRGVTIEKYRGSAHDERLRPFKITDQGIEVKFETPGKKAKEPKKEIAVEAETPQHPAVASPSATPPSPPSTPESPAQQPPVQATESEPPPPPSGGDCQ